MSIEAMVWVFDQDIKPATAKFVLLALADNCNFDGLAWPSLDEICRKTSMNIKTIIANLDILEDLGFLIDTGDRKGITGQVKIYKFNGLPSSDVHYVYRLDHIETGEFYIGVRSTIFPIENDYYFGSGKWPQSIKNSLLKKTILKVFEDRSSAESFEKSKILEYSRDQLCRNILSKGLKRKFNIPTLPRLETLPKMDGKITNLGAKDTRSWKPEPKRTLSEPQASKREINLRVFNHKEIDEAQKGDEGWDPDISESEMLPGGWDELAQSGGLKNADRRFDCWRGFKDITAWPYRRNKWHGWLKKDQAYQEPD